MWVEQESHELLSMLGVDIHMGIVNARVTEGDNILSPQLPPHPQKECRLCRHNWAHLPVRPDIAADLCVTEACLE